MEEPFDAPPPHVRGYSAYRAPAPWTLRIVVAACDALAVAAVWAALTRVEALGTVLVHPLGATLFLLLASVTVLATQVLAGATVGGWFWSVRRFGFSSPQLVRRPDLLLLGKGAGATALLTAGTLTLAHEAFTLNPYLLVADSRTLPAFLPPDANAGRWTTAPFYYSIGAWPLRAGGRPVSFRIPYLKGPPSHFVSWVDTEWSGLDARLRLEGPKTPPGGHARGDVRDCLRKAFPIFSRCGTVRLQVLERHVEEMKRSVDARRWSLDWIEVPNPAVPPEERPQGFTIRAEGILRFESRYVLLGPQGTHQTLILSGPLRESGAEARALLEQAIGSLRIPATLDIGRAWIDRTLSETRLEELFDPPEPGEPQNGSYEDRVEQVRLRLLAKISVDPKTYEAYFHLAGLSSMLLGRGIADADARARETETLEAAAKYAADVKPDDPRTRQLEHLARQFVGAQASRPDGTKASRPDDPSGR